MNLLGESILQLLLSDSEDDLKLQPLSSLIFSLSNAWHLDETVKTEGLEQSEFKVQFRKKLISRY